jgi:hypothetical protein
MLYKRVVALYTTKGMSEGARRKSAVERTRAWKAKNYFLLQRQRQRRWERTKAALAKARGIPAELNFVKEGDNQGTGRVPREKVQETYYADEEGVDIGYGDSRRKVGGDRDRGGRDGRAIKGDGGEVSQSGGSDRELGIHDESAGEGMVGVGDGTKPVSQTANEARTYAQLEEFKARRAQREAGVQVELIL